ncbi:hypothetical protein GCM10027563_12000 [Parasphingorhabdus pacifica]
MLGGDVVCAAVAVEAGGPEPGERAVIGGEFGTAEGADAVTGRIAAAGVEIEAGVPLLLLAPKALDPEDSARYIETHASKHAQEIEK